MEERELSRLIEAVSGKKVLVFGDVMVDEFLYGRVDRISPEAPVPVLEFTSHVFMPGGAANVARSVRSLGGDVALLGCIGQDYAADRLTEELERESIDASGLVRDPARPTSMKTRVVAHSQQVVRIDREVRTPIEPAVESSLLERLQDRLEKSDVVLVSDYAKGTVTPGLLGRVIKDATQAGVPIVADSKAKDARDYAGVTVLTPNLKEVESLSGATVDDSDGLERAASEILERVGCRALLVTRAERGMSLFVSGKEPVHIPALATEVHDVTGAGDTVVAAFGLALSTGTGLAAAAGFANLAAAVVVRKIGTATVSVEEVAEMFREWNLTHPVPS